jgi:hypothetical protein
MFRNAVVCAVAALAAAMISTSANATAHTWGPWGHHWGYHWGSKLRPGTDAGADALRLNGAADAARYPCGRGWYAGGDGKCYPVLH